jgi:cytochrome P450
MPYVSELPVIDFFDPAFQADPHAPFRALHGEHSVATDPSGASRIVFGFDEVEQVLKDPRVGVSDYAAASAESPLMRFLASQMLGYDPPEHTRLRRLVAPAFTVRRMEDLRLRIRALVDGLLAPFAERGELEAIADLGFPLPVLVIGEVLGVDEADTDALRVWSAALAAAFNPVMDPVALAAADLAVVELQSYLGGLIETRRARPGTAVVDELIAAEQDGERLTQDELISMMILLIFAGHETTKNLVGNGLHALLTHPEQLRRLRANPDLVPRAVEEMLRYDPPVGLVGRRALEDLEIGGARVPAGTPLACSIMAANRDPRRFVLPDRFDIERADAGHVSFGVAPHFCLGATLARIEADEVFRALLAQFEDLDGLDAPVARRESFVIRGFDVLRVGVRPGARHLGEM